MSYRLKLKSSVEKALQKINKKDYHKILLSLAVLRNDPFIGKKLKGEYQGYHSYRVWPYRIIYQVNKNQLIVSVIHIGHRQGAYKKF